MTPANLVRLTPVEAMRVGYRMGERGARAGWDCAQVGLAVDEVLGRLWWRKGQTAEVQRCFRCAVTIGYARALEEADRG